MPVRLIAKIIDTGGKRNFFVQDLFSIDSCCKNKKYKNNIKISKSITLEIEFLKREYMNIYGPTKRNRIFVNIENICKKNNAYNINEYIVMFDRDFIEKTPSICIDDVIAWITVECTTTYHDLEYTGHHRYVDCVKYNFSSQDLRAARLASVSGKQAVVTPSNTSIEFSDHPGDKDEADDLC